MIGRVIADRFRVVSLIARGGMGKVYRAEQAPLGRLCAIKILNPNYNGDADPEFHRRFFREASIASKITHPNSVTIFDYGKTDDEIYYMAMEYLEGQTLHHALREVKTMHEERVGKIAGQICRALREAHSLGVIHRDLKPANIFLMKHGDDEDFVKILDFGLVKHVNERPEEQLTQTGLFMGSPKYMAPEQIQGGHVDTRTDVYSLGIMMYEMLAGRVPFDRASSVNILMAHVGEPPPNMREVNPNIACSPAMEEIVMRSIAKDPNERPSTMDDVLMALRRVYGVSMTGQLAAINTSGSFAPVHLVNGPPSASGSIPPATALSSGPSASISMLGAEYTPAHQQDQARKTRWWIGLGVLLAAAVGGLLGMVAFRMSAPPEPLAPKPVVAATTTVAAATTSAATALTAAPVTEVTLSINTEPPGASVREDANELCVTTPCSVTFRGDDVEKTHRLMIQKPGFKAEQRMAKGSEGPLSVKLAKAAAGYVPPRPPPGKDPVKPPPDPNGTTPSGFKELPY